MSTMVSSDRHRKRAAQLRASNPWSRAAQLYELVARAQDRRDDEGIDALAKQYFLMLSGASK